MKDGEAYITGTLKEEIRSILTASGACAAGFAKAEPVDSSEWDRFGEWLSRGDNAGMEYMHNYPELRRDPRLLLEGAKTVISLAFSYNPAKWRHKDSGTIAAYAYGKDYHKELRRLLKPAVREISGKFPEAHFRICVDSAPILERYWAQKAGIGIKGDNGALIIPGFGSFIFLVEIITDLEISPDASASGDCGHCGACRRACPGNAIGENGAIDCRRCISYLTIEHRGEWTLPESIATMHTPEGHNTIYGCDICLRVCPHNRGVSPTPIQSFRPSEKMLSITAADILKLKDEEDLRSLLPSSPMSRAGIEGLLRNVGFSRSFGIEESSRNR